MGRVSGRRVCRPLAILRDRRGSTLIECVISLLLFTVVMGMLAMMLGAAGRISQMSAQTQRAVTEAANQAELSAAPGAGQAAQLDFVDGYGDAAASCPVTLYPASSGEVTLWKLGDPEGGGAP
ncbi:MAG: type IV pilus modification PilV family protein [Christensenellales bacterium]|jgi:Tfp pilus assembly protein PilV